MQPTTTITDLFYLVGSVQALFFGAILLADARRNIAKALLVTHLLSYAFATFQNFLWQSRYLLLMPHLAGVFSPFIYLIGPSLWLYVRLLTEPRLQLSIRQAWYAVPFLCSWAYGFSFYSQGASTKLAFIRQAYEKPFPGRLNPMIFLVFFHTFGYILASIVRLVQHRRVIRTEYSNVENRDLRWLSNLLILNAVLCVSWIVNTCTGHTWLQWPDALLTILSVFLLSFRGIRQNRVGLEASTSMGQQAGFPLELKSSRKYERSGLDDQQAIVYLTQLTKLMEEEKLYQNGELTLTELASRLAISPHHLSQLLNEKKGQSFYDYVNAYRVEEVKANLMDSRKRHLSLLAIALEAGFNSKTAFNTVFKKSTGLSPSEYRNQHQSAC